MTILELLVSSFLGLLIVGMAFSTLMSSQRTVTGDINRTRLSQNLRSVMDFLAVDSRQAGEQLPGIFPAIALADGGGTNPDTLTFRRNIISESLTICSNINAGSNLGNINLTTNSGGRPPVCVHGSQKVAYDSWNDYLAEKGGEFKAYIFNTSTRQGEFFTITGLSDAGSTMNLIASNKTFTNTYPRYTSVLYVIEEWQYSLSNDRELILVENQDNLAAKKIAFDITGFQVSIKLNDGSSLDTFDDTNRWGNISAIEISLEGESSSGKQIYKDSLNSKFFPRNILSL